MKALLTLALSLLSIIAISQPPIKDTTRPIQVSLGLTRELAIPIDTRTDYEGLPLERKWIHKHYPNSKILSFDMEGNGENTPTELYDIYLIKTRNKKYIRIYFKALYFNMNI